MAVDEEEWLPEPPPPRPARRDAAIEAALRRFDGAEEAAAAGREPPKRSWASTHRPQLGLAIAASLVVAIGVPAALIGLSNQPTPSGSAPPPLVRNEAPPPQAPAPAQEIAEAPQTVPNAVSPPQVRYEPVPGPVVEPKTEALAATAPPAAPTQAEAAAPPAPPPPPPPPAVGERTAEQAEDVAVTGARVAQPGLMASQGFAAKAADQARNESAPMASAYAAFLSRLQTAIRADDRQAIVNLVSIPLRVNSGRDSKIYRDRRSVERDFERIFTAKVRRAILAQRAGQLFVRDQGAMIGNGEVWFDQTCANAGCSPAGPVRITAINR